MALSKVGKNQVDQSASLTVDSDLTVDTNTLYVDSTNNRVGVGTASPVSTMDINGLVSLGGSTSRSINYRSGDNDILYEFDAGDFYRQNIGSSQHEFFTGNVNRMTIDSSGRVTMPYQPFFHGYWQGVSKAASWNFPSANPTSLINRGNHYNSSTGQFTCPVSGDYEIRCGGFILTGGNGERVGISFDKNGGGYAIGGGQLSTGDTPFPWNSVIIPCAVNDTLRVGQIYSVSLTAQGIMTLFQGKGVS